MKYRLEVKPAIPPLVRGHIERVLAKAGFKLVSGGSMLDQSMCDISFEDNREEKKDGVQGSELQRSSQDK